VREIYVDSSKNNDGGIATRRLLQRLSANKHHDALVKETESLGYIKRGSASPAAGRQKGNHKMIKTL
jgi:hypothetical protein